MAELEIRLNDAVAVDGAGRPKKYPWKQGYEGLDFSADNIAVTKIEKAGKEPNTLGEAVVGALTAGGKNTKQQALDKLFAICARLEERGLDPDRFTGNTVRLVNNVFYVEFPEDSGRAHPKVGVRLADSAVIESGYEELLAPKEAVVKKTQDEWSKIQEYISAGLAYDTVAGIYGATSKEANFSLRKQLWSKLGKNGRFVGSKNQNRELVRVIGENVNVIPDEPVARDDEADPAILGMLDDIVEGASPPEDGSAN